MPASKKRALPDHSNGQHVGPRKQPRVPSSSAARVYPDHRSSQSGPSSQSSLADRSAYTNPSSQGSLALSFQRPSSQLMGDGNPAVVDLTQQDDELDAVDLTQQDDEATRELYGTIGTSFNYPVSYTVD